MAVEEGSSGDIERLAEIKARAAAATPGPWIADNEIDGWRAGRPTVVRAIAKHGGLRIVTVDQTRRHTEPAEPNVRFIAAAREDIDYLLYLVDKLKDSYPDFGYE